MLDELLRAVIAETVQQTLQELGAMDHPKKDTPDIMTVKQLVDYIGMSESWIYQHIKDLPHERRGRKILFIKSEIDQWREEQRTAKEERHNKVVVVSPARLGNSKRNYYKVI